MNMGLDIIMIYDYKLNKEITKPPLIKKNK